MDVSGIKMCNSRAVPPMLQFSLHSVEGAVREDTERVTLRPGLHIALALHCRKWE